MNDVPAAAAYAACPKCGHAPMPAQQAFPATCPACGIVLAKFKVAVAIGPTGAVSAAMRDLRIRQTLDAPEPEIKDGSVVSRLAGVAFYVPAQVSRLNWQGRIVVLGVLSLWTLWIFRDINIPDGNPGSNFLHLVLTPFHEAGHYAIFRWFGQFIMILGGTLGQHLMPIVLGGALLIKRRDPFGAAVFFWLLGFSISDMGVYMYDAFDPQLMLLGGSTGAESDGHDWQNIFGDLGLLKRARGIGVFFGGAGRVVMLLGLAWGAWMLWLQKARLSDAAFAEMDHE
jgi:hypothetical protein